MYVGDWSAQIGDLVIYETLLGTKSGMVLKVIHSDEDLKGTSLDGVSVQLPGEQKAYFITSAEGEPDFVAGIPLRVISRVQEHHDFNEN